jgi:uncharacterized membrane protein YgdD (TMEM256/DUF423 family)
MAMEIKLFLFLASLMGTFGVAFGAMGSHLFKDRFNGEQKEAFETGVRFQLIHAAALFGWALSLPYIQDDWAPFALWMMVVGVILFSGSIYAYALSGKRAWAYLTPWGGTLLILSWILFTLSIAKMV